MWDYNTCSDRLTNTENKQTVARWEGLGENGEAIKYKSAATNTHGDVKYGMGNIENNILITMCGVRWVLDLLVGSLYKLYKCLITLLYT